jgi:hypothetical protein
MGKPHVAIPFGARFGRLHAQARTFGDKRGARYTFRCECGNTIVAHAVDVRRGQRKTCGCFLRYRTKPPVPLPDKTP